MMDKTSIERVEDIGRCAVCGGRCCKTAPGRFVPDDLEQWGGIQVDSVVALLATETAAIDCGLVGSMNSKMAPILMLAARGLNRPELDFLHGPMRCTHLTANGCSFPLDKRPFECAVIVPSDSDCRLPDDLHMEFFWLECQSVLREATERVSGRSWLDEVCRQIDNPKRTDPKIQGARRLVAMRGLANTALETDRIAEMARVIPY
jgi:hypothetical protein